MKAIVYCGNEGQSGQYFSYYTVEEDFEPSYFSGKYWLTEKGVIRHLRKRGITPYNKNRVEL